MNAETSDLAQRDRTLETRQCHSTIKTEQRTISLALSRREDDARTSNSPLAKALERPSEPLSKPLRKKCSGT